ncbi:homoserine O-acetyltransferase [Nocardioides sp.]|uniref:homoserine O-acetyltransferase MetX n=1 Tax=Nocardioides sp. TaxID=35761 RepID=UPI002603A8A7|nr:homoserine O-acetyltransferase [Nocardioides sp.]
MPLTTPHDPAARSHAEDQRRYVDLGEVILESGAALPVTVAYESWGEPRTEDGRVVNAILVLHALTGDSHVAGEAGPAHPTPGWWGDLVGPGKALDTSRWWVVAPNVLGGCRGTTGPGSVAGDGRPWGSRFPAITVRDQVAVEAAWASALGIDTFAAVVGGSMGGMRALEWLVGLPARVSSGVVLAVGAEASADQIGTQSTQITAITADPAWRGGDYHDVDGGAGPVAGLGIARRIAHLTYRCADELEHRFGRTREADGETYSVVSYLDHHADKLVGRFDAGSYVALTEAMNGHDVGRGRGGVRAALGTIAVPVGVGGITTDRLYPIAQQRHIAEAIPGAHFVAIDSGAGHDGFLVESEPVAALVRETLARL